MTTDISNNDFFKQIQNPSLQDEMSEDKYMDDEDSKNENFETSKEPTNEEDSSEYKRRQDRLRSPLTSQDIESGYQRNSENKLRIRSDQSTLGIRALHTSCLVPD